MNKKLLCLMVVVLGGLMFLSVGALTAAGPTPPAELSIENEGYAKDKKGPVHLSHEKHATTYEVACTECHHEFEDGKNVWKEGDDVKNCIDCHDPVAKKDNVMKLQNAYHRNCKNCHKALIAEDPEKNAPFKKCNDCHAKKS